MSEQDAELIEEVAQPGDATEIVLADRYRILPDSPISELGTPGAKAYVARDLKSPNEFLFARVCEPGVFPRVESMVQLKKLREVYAITPEDWNPITWPLTGNRCFGIVFRRPEGVAVMPTLASKIQKFDSETLVKSLLNPALTTLQIFERRKVTHRAIRPDNVFRMGAESTVFFLGECVSVPPSWGQSTIFETIESSMAPPTGRGKGNIADDIYALGATMLFLGLGFCPVVSMNERELLQAKIEKGSFAALISGEVAPPGLREPLRGMLSDDPLDRWTIEDLQNWVGGTLRRSARPMREYKTDRPYRFKDREYRNTRSIASLFGANWKAAAKELRSKEFDKWLNRGILDSSLIEDVTETIVSSSAGDDGGDAKLVTRVCALFDPEGPLRYKGLSVMPDGVGYALSSAVETGDKATIDLITEVVHKGIASEWFEHKVQYGRSDLTLEAKTFKRLQQFVRHAGPGYGVERVLYELNPFMPCRSKMIASSYVYSLRDLLPALDDIVAKTGKLPTLMDRHIAAFIASRISGSIDGQLSALEHSSGTSASSKIGMLGLLAKVQYEYQNQMTPHMTAWLVKELQPAIKRYYSRTLRSKIAERVEQIGTTGNLMDLYHVLSNENVIKRDERGKNAAKREYMQSQREIRRLESSEFQVQAKKTGWSIAAGISMCIGALTTVVVFSW